MSGKGAKGLSGKGAKGTMKSLADGKKKVCLIRPALAVQPLFAGRARDGARRTHRFFCRPPRAGCGRARVRVRSD